MANERLEQYFQHYAEILADDDEVANVTIVEIREPDCQYEMVMEDGATYRGWYYDGESIKDINWQSA